MSLPRAQCLMAGLLLPPWTPVLCWRWRIDAPVTAADMTQKSADDYAARVYPSFDVPRHTLGFGARARRGLARSIWGDSLPDTALSDVLDIRKALNTVRENACTERTGAADARRRVSERRAVRADFRFVEKLDDCPLA